MIADKVNDVGIGDEIQKYYPILFEIRVHDDELIRYYLKDVQAWAVGDISGIAGAEREIIMGLAQAMLNDLEKWEAQNWLEFQESATRIESREQEEHHG